MAHNDIVSNFKNLPKPNFYTRSSVVTESYFGDITFPNVSNRFLSSLDFTYPHKCHSPYKSFQISSSALDFHTFYG